MGGGGLTSWVTCYWVRFCASPKLHCLQLAQSAWVPKFPRIKVSALYVLCSVALASLLKQPPPPHPQERTKEKQNKNDPPLSSVPVFTRVAPSNSFQMPFEGARRKQRCKLCTSLKCKLKTSADGKQIPLSDADLKGIQALSLIKWFSHGTRISAV